MSKWLTNLLLVLVLLAGLSLLLYPTVADLWNSMHQSRAIATYSDTVAELDESLYERAWIEAHAYNQALQNRVSRYFPTEEETEEYNGILDITGTGIMGYIEIPKINVSLPIYHGTSDGVLQIAVGHIEGSSLPVGGAGTHCVLSGHRGLPSATLFTNLDQLAEGDTFMLHVLNETLTYEVDQIRVVLPEQITDLEIEPEQDYCTLVTCTPYGVNSHRLLVRGTRIETARDEVRVVTARITSNAEMIDERMVAICVAIPVLMIAFVVLMISTRKKR